MATRSSRWRRVGSLRSPPTRDDPRRTSHERDDSQERGGRLRRAGGPGRLTLVTAGTPAGAQEGAPAPTPGFDPVTRYTVSGAVAETVAATPDGDTLVFTDSETLEVGFVDISDPGAPVEIATVTLEDSPTSVAVTPDDDLVLVAVSGTNELVVLDAESRAEVGSIPLGGQPDSVTVNKIGRYAIAIENERDEGVDDGLMPQAPAGFLTIVALVGDPVDRTTRVVA